MDMVFLSFDPGLGNLGWSCLKKGTNGVEYVASGIHKQPAKFDIELRLKAVYDFLNTMVPTYHPDIIAFEKMFFRGRSDSAASTIKVIGLIELVGAQYEISLMDVAPSTLKKFITGHGRSDKKEIKKEVVRQILGIDPEIEQPSAETLIKSGNILKAKSHEIDAVAVGLWAANEY